MIKATHKNEQEDILGLYTLSNIQRFQKQGIYSALGINKQLVGYVNCPTFFEANFSMVLKNLKMFTPLSPVI